MIDNVVHTAWIKISNHSARNQDTPELLEKKTPPDSRNIAPTRHQAAKLFYRLLEKNEESSHYSDLLYTKLNIRPIRQFLKFRDLMDTTLKVQKLNL